jgi:hypothetical protein
MFLLLKPYARAVCFLDTILVADGAHIAAPSG